MAKPAKKTDEPQEPAAEAVSEILKEPAEFKYARELEALRQNEQDEIPSAWKLSPRSVLAYIVGAKKPLSATIDGKAMEVPISRKFFGDDTIVERSIVTLASERALLLLGDPGTGKSWLSEHLAAAISGCSTLTIQGTAGTTEEQIKYSWNIARIIAEGPKPENMIASPCMIAMRRGAIFRFEEITRCVGDVQDALVSICSDKNISVPELPGDNMVFARPGFNIIATANSRDQGVNELSAALKRRFNYVHIPVVADQKTEVEIVRTRSKELLERYKIAARVEEPVLKLLATVFREMRDGVTAEGVSVQKPSTTLSTAEAIGVALDAAIHSRHFGNGAVGPDSIGRNLIGSIVKEDLGDLKILKEYLNLVAKKRAASDPLWKSFYEAAGAALEIAMALAPPISELLEGLDAQRLEARAHAVLEEPLHWFPVRHHSPAVARHVGHTIRTRRPKIVFIEAPSDASDMVPHIVDRATKPPVALFCSYRDDDNTLGLAGVESPAPDVPFKVGVYYPLLPYSPEYIAMREAASIGARVVFIDLPHRAQIKSAAERGIGPDGEGAESKGEPSGKDGEAQDVKKAANKEDEHVAEHHADQPTWEHFAIESAFYRKLAEAAGYRSFDECWDALFDVSLRHSDTESFRRDMTYFCGGVRATTPRARMEQDGTLLREAHMWSTIQRTLRETGVGAGDAMVVCGGFHVFLERSAGPERALPAGTVYTTVAPYSYLRTSSHTGYGAGNRAPLYYERLFTHAAADPANAPVAAMVDHVVSVLARGRREGEQLSSADAISVTQHARMLASLRGRSAPILDDVRDALIACCCKGSPEHEGKYLISAMSAVETGTAVGRVTPALGKLPLVHDFYKWLDELDLGEFVARDRKAKLTLDLRNPEEERRSVFFHRLAQIGVPFAQLVSNEQESTLFREIWSIAWAPKVEAELIENSLYGESVESAALAKLDEELAKDAGAAGAVAERLLRAVNMDLPGMVMRLQDSAGAAIDSDTRLASLGKALTHLVVLERQAARRRLRKDLIDDLIERCFGRACFAMPNAANVPPEEHDEVVHGVKSLAEVLLGEKGADLDRDLFIDNARSTLADSKNPRLRGALSGILTEIRAQTPEALAAEVARFAKALPEEMVLCGDFLGGVMETSKTALMLGADGVVRAIDELLRAAAWEQFLILLPRTRGAFEAVHERTRVALADRVASLYGLQDDEIAAVTKLETSVGAAVKLSEIDARVGEIMKEWDFA